jgi:lincosamide nucleotidyltransferase A/C/D/E
MARVISMQNSGGASLWRLLRRRAVRAARPTYSVLERSRLAPLLRVPAVQRLKARITYMPASRVIAVLDSLAAAGVRAWVGGGWGVDALVGRQTRRHYDLDLVIGNTREEYLRVEQVLTAAGFRPAGGEFNAGLAMPLRRVWHHDDGHNVEVLPVALQRPPFNAAPADAQASDAESPFTHGSIGGQPVPCLSAGLQLALHAGYPLRDIDADDIGLLRTRVNRPEGTTP